jgi:ubiquinone/menaquinone biosynthesis C-methylase UbiE
MADIRSDPDHDEYLRRWTSLYQRSNYDKGLAAYFLRKSHEWAERPFGADDHFARVLEVGAGSGEHLEHVRHRFDEYVMTDANPAFLEQAAAKRRSSARGRIVVAREDATRLSIADGAFDRLIATHVLEHLPQPQAVLREWARVVRPGGTVTLVLPCDPGFLWRFGRRLGPRATFTRAGIDYDYWMAREHINAINNLVTFVRFYFDDIDERWLPLRIPSMDLNLFYIAHVRVK